MIVRQGTWRLEDGNSQTCMGEGNLERAMKRSQEMRVECKDQENCGREAGLSLEFYHLRKAQILFKIQHANKN